MGDMADYYAEQNYDPEWEDPPTYVPASKKKWRLADGTIVKITDMGDRHLENTIAYLKRTNNTDLPQFARMERELRTREKVI